MKKALAYVFVFILSFSVFSQERWQQKVVYTMDIDMDVNSFEYDGYQEIIYTNNSPDTIQKVYYHLFFKRL